MTEIQKKMIDMVDFDSFKEAVKVSAETSGEIKNEYVRWYLEKWAVAKEHIFKLFGEQFEIKIPVKVPVNRDVISEKIEELCKQYPQYAATVKELTIDEICANEVSGENSGLLKALFPRIYRKGGKASSILSRIIKDEQFDIDLSKILQNRVIDGVATISIHPLDFVTLSTNTHKWGSCMDIIHGFNKIGGFSLMMDKPSTIAFFDHGGNTTYKNKFGSFEWNNKIFRQIIYVDTERKMFAFGHYNGTVDESIRDKWAEKVNELLGTNHKKKSEGRYSVGYATEVGQFYYDSSIYAFYPSEFHIDMGVKEIKCIVCGAMFRERHSYKNWLTCNGGHKK